MHQNGHADIRKEIEATKEEAARWMACRPLENEKGWRRKVA